MIIAICHFKEHSPRDTNGKILCCCASVFSKTNLQTQPKDIKLLELEQNNLTGASWKAGGLVEVCSAVPLT